MIASNPEVPSPVAQAEATALIAALNHRYAVKRFDPARKIDAATWNALEEALTLTPSGFGVQPWKFIVVDDPAVRVRLQEVSYGQPQIVEADRLVVFTARKGFDVGDVDHFIGRVAEVRGQPLESLGALRDRVLGLTRLPEANLDAWTARQTYIALGNFLTSAAVLGVDACPMEGLDRAKFDEILGLESLGYATFAVATAGYRSTEDKYATLAKVRFAREQVIKHV